MTLVPNKREFLARGMRTAGLLRLIERAPRLPWWDRVAYVVNRCRLGVLQLDRPEPMAIDLGSGPRTSAIARVVRACLDHNVDDDPEFRAHLQERAGVEVDDGALGHDLFMTW